MAIAPFVGYFSKETLLAACAQATRDVAQLTDQQLSIMAVYDLDGARVLETKRARAWEDAERAEALARAALAPVAVTPAPAGTGITAEVLDALVDGLGEGLRNVLAPLRKQISDLHAANEALERKVVVLEGLVADRAVGRDVDR
ncbi:MAG TPA: hypothetical protein VKE96_17480 [Vicinamibacterales bacterium]|nr:hypothetical protein [Vicinamibacterales bacterium]